MIQYRHRNCDKAFTPATFAYQLPPASLFVEMVKRGEPVVNFPFALTKLHHKDQYCRATGRSKAEHNLHHSNPRSFMCEKVELESGRSYFYLNCFKGEIICCVSVNFQTEKVRMEWIDFA